MEHATTIALSRQMTLRRAMDIVANNVANVNTPGFKAESAIFSEFLMPLAEADDRHGQPGVSELSYVIDSGIYRNLAEGNLEQTGNPLDMAISGDGYFSVQTENGPRYTRAGHFSLDAQGRLVTSAGDPVLSDAGAPIALTPENGPIEVSRDGTISQNGAQVGRIGVVSFANERALTKTGNGYFETAQAPVPVAAPTVLQGMVEGSNVQPVVEMTRMIEVMRAYQSAQRSIDKMSELSQAAIRQLGRQPA